MTLEAADHCSPSDHTRNCICDGFDQHIIVEAVFENSRWKSAGIRRNRAIAKPWVRTRDQHLLYSTWTRSRVYSSAGDGIGVHFCTARTLMRLVEIVSGKALTLKWLSTAGCCENAGKVGVLAGNLPRLHWPSDDNVYGREAQFSLEKAPVSEE